MSAAVASSVGSPPPSGVPSPGDPSHQQHPQKALMTKSNGSQRSVASPPNNLPYNVVTNSLPPGASSRAGRWTPDEKLLFLHGLKMYGRGRWKKIRNFLPTRTLIQIKSHAQKVLKREEAGDDIFAPLKSNKEKIVGLVKDKSRFAQASTPTSAEVQHRTSEYGRPGVMIAASPGHPTIHPYFRRPAVPFVYTHHVLPAAPLENPPPTPNGGNTTPIHPLYSPPVHGLPTPPGHIHGGTPFPMSLPASSTYVQAPTLPEPSQQQQQQPNPLDIQTPAHDANEQSDQQQQQQSSQEPNGRQQVSPQTGESPKKGKSRNKPNDAIAAAALCELFLSKEDEDASSLEATPPTAAV